MENQSALAVLELNSCHPGSKTAVLHKFSTALAELNLAASCIEVASSSSSQREKDLLILEVLVKSHKTLLDCLVEIAHIQWEVPTE